MEHRRDLEDLLMSGLPDDERQHIADAIRETTAAKLRRKRTQRDRIIDLDEDIRADYP
jgi:hypothetical protein